MPELNIARTRDLLKRSDLKTLFINELGWDHHSAQLPVTVNEQAFTLSAIAEKRGMVAFQCGPCGDGSIPDYATRRKIERQMALSVHEHLIVYADAGRTAQVWQWVRREPGKPDACREQVYQGNTGDLLIQKLKAITFSLDEEEGLTIVEVSGRLRAAFNIEHVTKRFYERFKTEHDAFLKLLKGIPDEDLQRWYVSVMLNRLMFIYFIQKKGFLDGDTDYLNKKLAQSQQRGNDRFYRDVLCPLFFDGFARRDRSPELTRLLGKVPYLNGGIFMRHQIEQSHGRTIQIADAAFERLFEFFDAYQWHLDERPLREGNEINPDVLGYIFEKYINQKQMGAYYTKEDITEYISKSTIVPYLFDVARHECRIAFEGEHSIWRLLQDDPDRYIYDAVKKGVEQTLPSEVAAGLKDVSRRTEWNRPASTDCALPTEIWREVVARRQHYEQVRARLANGEIHDINDFITCNLNIRQFAQDVIEACEGPELLRAFWHAIEQATVLDPTCGSGAFLFAALNILEPLYEACLDRMQAFLEEDGQLSALTSATQGERVTRKYSDFRKVLEQVAKHPNRRYFIYKSIIVNNLYGVDIMEEATEICKLRLFLKLVALVEHADQVEPLPDIDFNIRAGNTLVGYVTREQVKEALTTAQHGEVAQGRLLSAEDQSAIQRIEEKAQDVERLFGLFRQQQTELGGQVTPADKQALRDRLKVLEDELNIALAHEYGIDVNKPRTYQKWLESHQPFHWFVEFYGILKRGGFDVIIGNPPWKEYASVKKVYSVNGYITEKCGNLYALCTERVLSLRESSGWMSFIVQLPMGSSSRMEILRKLIKQKSDNLFVISFGDRPGKLFSGLEHSRSIVFVSQAGNSNEQTNLFTTRYQRWPTENRVHLFPLLEFIQKSSELIHSDTFPKYGNATQESLFHKVKIKSNCILNSIMHDAVTGSFIFYQEATEYWVKATCGLPYYAKNGSQSAPIHGRFLYFKDKSEAHLACAFLNSSLFWLYFIAYGDCFHLSNELVCYL